MRNGRGSHYRPAHWPRSTPVLTSIGVDDEEAAD